MANPERHERLLSELTATSDGFLQSIREVNPVQWLYKPAPEVWSVGETAEHIATVFRGVQRLLTSDKIREQPLPPRSSGQRVNDESIIRAMFDRSRRMDAPEPVRPRNRWSNREELTEAFLASREELVRWFGAVDYDLRLYGSPHLVMGTLDGVQWLLFVAAHTERHTHQILGVKQGPGYPK